MAEGDPESTNLWSSLLTQASKQQSAVDFKEGSVVLVGA